MRTRALPMLAALALVVLVLHLVSPAASSDPVAASRPPDAGALAVEASLPATARAPAPVADPASAAGPPASSPHSPAVHRAATLPPGQRQQVELRRRVASAAGLARRAASGDDEARRAVAAQLATEADPRVRLALATGEQPDLGRTRQAPPPLPEAATAAEAGSVRAYWLTPGSVAGTYESAIAVGADGRASVETEFEQPDGERWRVRYPAWAYRDAQGRLVIDARGQQVEYLQRPPYGSWSPDSMVIGRDGLIDMIDDKHDPGSGTSGAQGPG